MDNAMKRRNRIIVALALILLLVSLLLIFIFFKKGKDSPGTYDRGENPEGFAEIAADDTLTDEELYDAYDPANDPAHPVLDERVSVSISSLGSRPGEARPQDIELEYPGISLPPAASATPEPTSTPSAT
ncbi:MAG TPA: hypothetical protein VN540_03310, partial [Clostridia bacterium]|nr:hypothetical protein [Clostridia bacterium]